MPTRLFSVKKKPLKYILTIKRKTLILPLPTGTGGEQPGTPESSHKPETGGNRLSGRKAGETRCGSTRGPAASSNEALKGGRQRRVSGCAKTDTRREPWRVHPQRGLAAARRNLTGRYDWSWALVVKERCLQLSFKELFFVVQAVFCAHSGKDFS